MENIQMISYITTIIANVSVVLSLIVALIQLARMRKANELSENNIEIMRKSYTEEHIRNLRQSTIEFYDMINVETKDLIDDVVLGKVHLSLDNILGDDVLHRRVRRYLSLMERFSVGIHSNMYDLAVFNRIQGKTTQIIYAALEPYIEYIAEKHGTAFYGDFVGVVKDINKMRNKDDGTILCPISCE